MNKEQIIDEAYREYANSHEYFVDGWMHVIPMEHSKETFVNECKTNPKFAKRWGLKIEERELTPKERIELAGGKIQDKYPALVEMSLRVCDERDIPTKLITIKYNDKTIESYE